MPSEANRSAWHLSGGEPACWIEGRTLEYGMEMDYERWIRREQRIRLKILRASPEMQKTGIYRACATCGELCLCHEEICPNCDCNQIVHERLAGTEADHEKRIRCKSRFARLA